MFLINGVEEGIKVIDISIYDDVSYSVKNFLQIEWNISDFRRVGCVIVDCNIYTYNTMIFLIL